MVGRHACLKKGIWRILQMNSYLITKKSHFLSFYFPSSWLPFTDSLAIGSHNFNHMYTLNSVLPSCHTNKKARMQLLTLFPLEYVFHFFGPYCILDMVSDGDSGFYYFSPLSIVFFKQCYSQYHIYIYIIIKLYIYIHFFRYCTRNRI